jgi:hypothetical protein
MLDRTRTKARPGEARTDLQRGEVKCATRRMPAKSGHRRLTCRKVRTIQEDEAPSAARLIRPTHCELTSARRTRKSGRREGKYAMDANPYGRLRHRTDARPHRTPVSRRARMTSIFGGSPVLCRGSEIARTARSTTKGPGAPTTHSNQGSGETTRADAGHACVLSGNAVSDRESNADGCSRESPEVASLERRHRASWANACCL